MAKPQHRTPEYVAAYKDLKRRQRAGEYLVCAEPVCTQRTRAIAPTDKASVSHDPTGTVIIGYSHLPCNLGEAARRGNRMRARPPRSWVF